jgi:hypothetical protein
MKRLLVIAVLFLVACSQPKTDLPEWMLGEWQMREGVLLTIEKWEKHDEKLIGLGFTMDGVDTVFLEEMRIERIGDSLFFTADPNTATHAVTFAAAHTYSKDITFRNDEHDFPNSIRYYLEKDVLKAQVAGAKDTIHFDFRR